MITIFKSTFKDGSVVQHPIVIIDGAVSTRLTDYIEVCNETSLSSLNWPVIFGQFKILVILKPGANLISLRHGFYSKQLHYKLSVRQSSYIVQPLYIVSKDGEGCYQSPSGTDNSTTSAVKKISLGSALLQTFTMSNLQSHGLGMRTFQLPLDDVTGLPVCKVFRSKFSTEEIFALSEKELWRSLARELMESDDIHNRYTSKFLGFIAATRYDGSGWKSTWRHADVVSATKGHIALGGGGLALLGTGTLHTWADSLDNLVQCFTDETAIDSTQLMDDSAYRSTYWANYSTGLGAALHELGHTFDLSHTQTGIMSRGFDNMHKFFVLDKAKPVARQRQQEVDKLNHLKLQLELLTKQADADRVDCTPSPSSSTCTVIRNLSFSPKSSNDLRQTDDNSTIRKKVEDTSTSFTELPPYSPLLDGTKNETRSAGLTPVTSVTSTSAASSWSSESALMLSTSRWLLHDDEIPCYKSQGSKPALGGDGTIKMTHGLRVIQVYVRCLDRIVYSQPGSEESETILEISNITSKYNVNHKAACDQLKCAVLHLRDVYGIQHIVELSER